MNCADESRAENIGKIGGHGGKTAAIHRGNDAKGGRETATAFMPARVGAMS